MLWYGVFILPVDLCFFVLKIFLLEIHLKDLLYQTEAQPNWADEANGIINFGANPF